MKTLCLVAALGLALSCAAARAAELKAGDPAPEFSLVGSDGKTHTLSDVPRQAGRRPGLVPEGLHRRLNEGVQVAP